MYVHKFQSLLHQNKITFEFHFPQKFFFFNSAMNYMQCIYLNYTWVCKITVKVRCFSPLRSTSLAYDASESLNFYPRF